LSEKIFAKKTFSNKSPYFEKIYKQNEKNIKTIFLVEYLQLSDE